MRSRGLWRSGRPTRRRVGPTTEPYVRISRYGSSQRVCSQPGVRRQLGIGNPNARPNQRVLRQERLEGLPSQPPLLAPLRETSRYGCGCGQEDGRPFSVVCLHGSPVRPTPTARMLSRCSYSGDGDRFLRQLVNGFPSPKFTVAKSKGQRGI